MIGAHLKEGSIVYTTAEIVIGILPAVLFERAIDPTSGF
jgi:predicted DNA-binding protein with PD1-like motif